MGRFIVWTLLLFCLAGGDYAAAGSLTIQVADSDGRPLADAVISLTAKDSGPVAVSATPAPVPVIDQRDETFIPLVTIIPSGGSILFRNSDDTRHHVYSFSPLKQFEFVLEPGEDSKPVQFDNPGIVAIGCNIHDQMVAFAYVAATPWTALTGPDGRAVIADVPDGVYSAQAWHPRLRPGNPPPPQTVTIGSAPTALSITIAVLTEHKHRMTHERPY